MNLPLPAAQRSLAGLAFGFGLLILLIVLQGVSAYQLLSRVHLEAVETKGAFRDAVAALARIQSSTYESAILVRDHLIRPSELDEEQLRSDLVRLRKASRDDLAGLAALGMPVTPAELKVLREKIDAYWSSFDAAIEQSIERTGAMTASVIEATVVPKRMALLAMTHEIERSNLVALGGEKERLKAAHDRYARGVRWTFGVALSLAVAVAAFSLVRTRQLEERSARQRDRAEGAEEELRRLSRQLVRTQEEERKALSRELHDEIGQKLTAIRLELRRVDRLRPEGTEEFEAQLNATKSLVDESLRSVRDLSMGLRPSMLDDLGLEPALGWQAREFSRRTGIAVELACDPDIEGLREPIRTCLYRVTQEALTNCARHSRAKTVSIAVRRESEQVALTVEDDGIGFQPSSSAGAGLGLLGIKERVHEVGGTVEVDSRLYLGTRVTARIPLPEETDS